MTTATGLKLSASRRDVLEHIATHQPSPEHPLRQIVFSVAGWVRLSFIGTAGDVFARKVTRQCEDMAAAGWIVEGDELPRLPYYSKARPWLITDAGRAVLAGPPAEVAVQLTRAQADRIMFAHADGGQYKICDQSWVGEVDNRNSVHAMVRAGLLVKTGLDSEDPTLTVFGLTDAGRRAYAASGHVIRRDRDRCTNPICCGTWPEDLPIVERPYGSCRRCGRWVSVRKGGMGRHTIQRGVQCPGVGSLPEGAETPDVA